MRHLFFEKLKFGGSIFSLAFVVFALTSFVFIDDTNAIYREYNEVHCMNNRGNYRPFACNAEEYGFGWSGVYGFDDGFTWEGSGCTIILLVLGGFIKEVLWGNGIGLICHLEQLIIIQSCQ